MHAAEIPQTFHAQFAWDVIRRMMKRKLSLVLLHYAGQQGFTRRDLGKHARCSPTSVTRAIDALVSPDRREVVQVADGRFILGDLGQKCLREQMAGKLLLE